MHISFFIFSIPGSPTPISFPQNLDIFYLSPSCGVSQCDSTHTWTSEHVVYDSVHPDTVHPVLSRTINVEWGQRMSKRLVQYEVIAVNNPEYFTTLRKYRVIDNNELCSLSLKLNNFNIIVIIIIVISSCISRTAVSSTNVTRRHTTYLWVIYQTAS